MPVSTIDNSGISASAAISTSKLGTGAVLQVVSVTKTDTWSESQSPNTISSNNVTGLIATITPTSSSSKILVAVNLNLNISASGSGVGVGFALYRSGTKIAMGDTAGSRTSLSSAGNVVTIQQLVPMSMNYLDSPATTSSLSYSIRLWCGTGTTATAYVNAVNQDTDAAYVPRSISSVTLMEIAA